MLHGASQEIQEKQKGAEKIEETQKHKHCGFRRTQSHWVWLVGHFLAQEFFNPRFHVALTHPLFPYDHCLLEEIKLMGIHILG